MISFSRATLLLLITISLLLSGCVDSDLPDYNLTLISEEFEENLTLSDLRQMPSYTGHGYLISTVGIRYGPFVGKGVKIVDIIERMGGLDESDRLYIYGSDGYLWVIDSKQAFGEEYVTFDTDLRELHGISVVPVLMYEQDGKQLTEEDGGPVRFALLTDESGIITEGSAWVKWISKIELHR